MKFNNRQYKVTHPGTGIKPLLGATSLQRTGVEMHLAVLNNSRIINY